MNEQYQPRFVAYAKAHNCTPEEILAADTATYPGGKMTGFLLWLQKEARAFKQAHPEHCVGYNIHNQAAFTEWLEAVREPAK